MRRVDGVDYDQVVTERLQRSPQSVVRQVLGERRPSGGCGRRCAANGARTGLSCTRWTAAYLDLERALNIAESRSTRLYTLCGCAQELTPMIKGFDHFEDYGSGE
ncbi:hypothetical protein [Streptomyces longisporus]|uniref:hypothetical protein n=1 Tax=Streptomyces longisporus TaxID=1948 RepID=UPI0031D1C2AB